MSKKKEPNFECPNCGPIASDVKDSRRHELAGSLTIRRRRWCPSCEEGFTTYELTDEAVYKATKGLFLDLAHQAVDLASDHAVPPRPERNWKK